VVCEQQRATTVILSVIFVIKLIMLSSFLEFRFEYNYIIGFCQHWGISSLGIFILQYF
jgi:hypothetical protein